MRTTITLDSDVAAAVDQVRRGAGVGISEAVNRLIRAALVHQTDTVTYRHQTSELGLRIDVSNVAEVLDLLDQA